MNQLFTYGHFNSPYRTMFRLAKFLRSKTRRSLVFYIMHMANLRFPPAQFLSPGCNVCTIGVVRYECYYRLPNDWTLMHKRGVCSYDCAATVEAAYFDSYGYEDINKNYQFWEFKPEFWVCRLTL